MHSLLADSDGFVYDLTRFEKLHPGGQAVLRFVAGEDATDQFYSLHTKAVLDKYHERLVVGRLDDDAQYVHSASLEQDELVSEVMLLCYLWQRA